MTEETFRPANFTISDNAKRGIEELRRSFDSQSSEPAAVATIGWARYIPYVGAPYERAAVTFYTRSQYREVSHAIQIVSGIEVVYVPVAEDYAKFEGKVLDWNEGDGFYLREP
jgi:hypothetical protein